MRKIILLLVIVSFFIIKNLSAQYWSAVGQGIPGGIYSVGVVYSTAVYNGELYVGGIFDTAGGLPIKNIAKWNGTNWSPVGSGMGNSDDAMILSLKVYNGELYAGGRFDSVDGVPVKNIAKWNGAAWSPVGTGIISSAVDQPVYAITVHNGMLYAAGHFDTAGNISANNIAKWDGVAWSSLGTGINGRVSALLSYNGSLYAGGNFTAAGGNAARCIAKWDGINWSPLGTGINDYGVFCLGVYNDALYAGGWFTEAGGVAARSLAKWNGINWSSVGNVVGEAVLSLFAYNDTLYVGGSLTPQNECIAKWNGINWSLIGDGIGDYNGGSVWSINEYNGSIYAGGGFQAAGHVQVNNIAKWTNQCSLAPIHPGNINGSVTACQNSYVTYSVDAVNDAADFTWTLPAGWSGSSVSNSITALVGSTGGIISVIANNPCGSSDVQTLAVNVNPVPSIPSAIIGNQPACGNTTQLYSVDSVPGATNYTWMLPYGWTGSSTTNSISVMTGEWSGELAVSANNDYCRSDLQTFYVNINGFTPPRPDSIKGNTSVCQGSTNTYSVNTVTGADTYTWSLPAGWTGNSTSNTITAIAGTNGGVISVTANNTCGSSIPQALTISVNSIPPQPSLIIGADSVCEGTYQTYFVDPVTTATGYEWNVPLEWSANPDGDSISIIACGYSGELSVTAYNDCGTSIPQVLPIDVALLPQLPDYIVGDSRVCDGTSHLYFISPVQNATNYTWILPAGWTGNSNTDSITTIAFNGSGSISVKANNQCGSSPIQSLWVQSDPIPAKPTAISGNTYTYTDYINYYTTDKVLGATSYSWFTENGIIQISPEGNSISVTWKKPGTYKLTVKAINNCDTSEELKLNVHVLEFNEDDPFDISIYPNPTNGVFHLTAKYIQDKIIRVEVLTISGQTIYISDNRTGLNDYTQLIDLKKLPQGLYTVIIAINDKVYTRKIVKTQ